MEKDKIDLEDCWFEYSDACPKEIIEQYVFGTFQKATYVIIKREYVIYAATFLKPVKKQF